jgi:type IV pilus assembly protein PilW
MKHKSHQSGMTLIELMIALLIGAFLLAGILQIFISSRQTYRMQEALSRLQENGRFALELIDRDVRMAGYWFCLTPSSPDTDIDGTNDNAVNGDDIDDDTDTLTLKGAFTQTPTGVCGTAVDTAAAYYTDLSSTITYRINNDVLEQGTNNQWNPLVDGIEDMQILYGEDTDADNTANYYVPAGTAGLVMANVVSIRITLSASTIDNNLTTAGDGRIRRNFNSTIAVRNRLP